MIASKMFICFIEQEVIQVSNIYFVFGGKKESLKLIDQGRSNLCLHDLLYEFSHLFNPPSLAGQPGCPNGLPGKKG